MTLIVYRKESRTGNSTYPKGGVSCFADSFVVAENSVLRIKFSVKSPARRAAASRYRQPYNTKIKPLAKFEFQYFKLNAAIE